MIYEHTPYSPDGQMNLGKAYNNFMRKLKDDEYALFRDHDTCFTTYNWYPQIEAIIHKYRMCGAFTCMTNRVFCKWQLAEVDRNSDDMKYHWKQGKKIQERFGTLAINKVNDHWMSGVMILVRKSTWKKIGGFKEGLLGIDNEFHKSIRRSREKLFLMKGVYLYHVYSFNNLKSKRDISHLK